MLNNKKAVTRVGDNDHSKYTTYGQPIKYQNFKSLEASLTTPLRSKHEKVSTLREDPNSFKGENVTFDNRAINGREMRVLSNLNHSEAPVNPVLLVDD